MSERTGRLGDTNATLGKFALGGGKSLMDVVTGTPGLIGLWKCDDPISQSAIHGLIQPTDDLNVNVGANSSGYTQVSGLNGYALQTPNAHKNADHDYDTSYHTEFQQSYPLGTDIGDAGTVEFWFSPSEFADLSNGYGGYVTDGYDILRLTADVPTGTVIRFITAWYSQFDPAPGNKLIAVYNSNENDPGGLKTYRGIASDSPLPWDPLPIAELGRWYHLAIAWDRTSRTVYCNGRPIQTGVGNSWTLPAGMQNIKINFGGNGGRYDLVSVYNRRLSDAEIAAHFAPVLDGSPSAPSGVRVTTAFANYAATYTANARLTVTRAEVLRAASRSMRLTATRLEVLRSVTAESVYNQDVLQYLTLTQTVSTDYVRSPKNPVISQSLAFTQTATATVQVGLPPQVFTESVTQTLGFTQTAKRTRAAVVTQTLAFNPTVTAVASHSARDTLAFTQTISLSMVRDRKLLQVLPLTDSQAMQAVHNVAVTDTLTIVDTTSFGHVRTASTLQVLNLTDGVEDMVVHTYYETCTDTLAFTDLGEIRYGKQGAATQVLLLVDRVYLNKVYVRHVSQTLAFTQTLPRPVMSYHRGVTDTLLFYEKDLPTELPIIVGGDPVFISPPIAVITKVRKSVILQSRDGAVVLPVPEFDDSDSSGDTVTVKRTMTGRFFTYVKTSPTRQLDYTFKLGRKKSLELRNFVRSSFSKVIHLTNWKGEIYVGQFLSNDVTFTTEGRYAYGGELVNVGINFEGVKIH